MKQDASSQQLDDDDKFLIELMIKKKTVQQIAKKLRQPEWVIQEYLDHKKKLKDHGTEEEEKNCSSSESSLEQDEKDTVIFKPEAKFGLKGADCISMKCEALQQNAICKIHSGNKSNWSCSGFLVDLKGRVGVLLSQHVLPTENDCANAQAVFEKDGVEHSVQLTPDIYYWTNEQLDATFVSCDHEKLFKNGIRAVEHTMFDNVEVGSPLSMYYFTHGLDKGQLTFKAAIKKNYCFGYKGTKTPKNTYGSALFCGNKLVGVHHGEIRTLKNGSCKSLFNEAISIKAIEKWIGKERVKSFSPGEVVLAQWTDGHKYNAKILCKTELGYRVNYYEFGPDEEEDLAISNIHKIAMTETPYDMRIEQEDDLEVESKKESKPDLSQLDQDDIDMINGLLENSTSADVIAMKLHKPVKLIQAFVDSLATTSDVKDWLEKLGIGKYTDKFISQGYKSLEMIKSLNANQRKEMITSIGLKPGSAIKIKNSLDDMAEKATPVCLESITNTPMSSGWVPDGNGEKNLTTEFQRKNGTCSVRETCETIKRDYKNGGSLPEIFYVKSTTHKLFFKIHVTFTKSSK